MSTLYEIALDFRAVADKLADLSLPDDVVADTLDAEVGLDFKAKMIGVAVVYRNMTAEKDMISAEIDRLSSRMHAVDKRSSRLRAYAHTAMNMTDQTKIDSPLFDIKIVKNPPAVEVFDESAIPMSFMIRPPVPEPVPDKKAIKEALKEGRDVGGCRLTQGERLVIK